MSDDPAQERIDTHLADIDGAAGDYSPEWQDGPPECPYSDAALADMRNHWWRGRLTYEELSAYRAAWWGRTAHERALRKQERQRLYDWQEARTIRLIERMGW